MKRENGGTDGVAVGGREREMNEEDKTEEERQSEKEKEGVLLWESHWDCGCVEKTLCF